MTPDKDLSKAAETSNIWNIGRTSGNVVLDLDV